MEIISIITNQFSLVNELKEFLYKCPKLNLKLEDKDTAYFTKVGNSKFEIYLHFVLNNLDEELLYNYSEHDVRTIKEYFDADQIYIFDLSYKDNLFVNELLDD